MKSRQWSRVSGAIVWWHKSNGLMPREQWFGATGAMLESINSGALEIRERCFVLTRMMLLPLQGVITPTHTTQGDALGYELLALQAVFVPSAISLPMIWGVGKLQIVILFCFLSAQYFAVNYVSLIDEET